MNIPKKYSKCFECLASTHPWLYDMVDEMIAKHDGTVEILQNALECSNETDMHKQLRIYKGKLEHEREQNAKLSKQLGTVMAENDIRRAEIGEMLDAAHAIERIRAKYEA